LKKNILILLLILSVAVSPAFSEEMFETADDLDKIEEYFYESPTPIPDVKTVQSGSKHRHSKAMPLFKKTRIKLTNYLLERDYKRTQKLLEKEKQLIEEEKEDNKEISPTVSENPTDENTLELVGSVKEHVTSKDVQLDADNIDFDEATSDMTATGSPVLYFPPQDTTVKAEKMVYNNGSNILKAYGKVEVIKGDKHVYGDYIQINMNEENAFMDNIKTDASFLTVTARKSEIDDKQITLYNGKMVSENSYRLDLKTKMIGGNFYENMIVEDDDKVFITDKIGDIKVNVKAEDVIVNAKKNHDTITFKKLKMAYGDVDLFKIRSLTVHTNKNHEFFEANYPELGSRSKLGMFAGPGFVIDTPFQNGSTLKLIPMINNKSGIGIGGLAKYQSATNHTDFGYGSAADIFILRGRQELDDHLFMQYGANSYMDEWFLGSRMAKYDAELVYQDGTTIPSTIGENKNLKFKHRAGIGYMHNTDFHNRLNEHIKSNNMGTMRMRYMAEAVQDIYKYNDKQNQKMFNLSLVMQGSAAVYGTGDTQFIGRIGPRITSQYKRWMQQAGYYASGYQDGTPMALYDCYRYGHSSVYLKEAFRISKYLTLAWSTSMTLTNDAPNGKTFQENAFIVSLGPSDFKLNLGYDWVRKHTYFSFVIAMDTKGSSVEFDRMVIKNPDRLAKSDDEKVELKVFDEGQKTTVPKKMKYAEVIDIEDPDKEEI